MNVSLILIGAALLVLFALIVGWLIRRSWGNFPAETPRQPPISVHSSTSTEYDSEVLALIAQGNKIAAIKQVRDTTGLGLKEAKDYVDAIADGRIISVQRDVTMIEQPLPEGLEAMTRQWLAEGSKIAAIKQVRDMTGLGLKEAKDYVDAIERG